MSTLSTASDKGRVCSLLLVLVRLTGWLLRAARAPPIGPAGGSLFAVPRPSEPVAAAPSDVDAPRSPRSSRPPNLLLNSSGFKLQERLHG